MSERGPDTVSGLNSADILFDCPVCGKSLEIDARGAGYLITCPDCKHEVEVPVMDSPEDGDAEESDLVSRLESRIESLQRAAAFDDQSLRRIGDEMQLIQAALDRINEIIQSRIR